jgi:hypothetical protein
MEEGCRDRRDRFAARGPPIDVGPVLGGMVDGLAAVCAASCGVEVVVG